MVSGLQKQVRPQHQTQAMSRAADGQYGHASTGTTWSSERTTRGFGGLSFPPGSSPTRHAIAPTLPSPHPSLKPSYEASIMNASGRGGTSLHLSSRMHAVSTKVHSPLRYIYHQQSSLTRRMSRCLSLDYKAASLHEWNIPSKSCSQTCETRHRSRHYPEMTLSRLDYTPSTMSRAVDLKYRKLLPIR